MAGFVEESRFYLYLGGRKNLELLAAYDGGGAAERIDDVLEQVDLTARARDKVGGYSHGMRQRLGIAASLLRAPRLLLLDEPTTGLDPAGMRDMRSMVRGLAARGMTIVLSSHLLAEVEELCNRVAIVRSGRIVYEGALDDLKRSGGVGYRLETTDNALTLRVLTERDGIGDVRPAGNAIEFSADHDAVAALSPELARHGIAVLALVPEAASLEALFFRLTEEADGSGADGRPDAVEAAA